MKKLSIAVVALALVVAGVFLVSRKAHQSIGGTTFPVIADLNLLEQKTINDLLVRDSSTYTASESAYLALRAAYRYNRIIDRDANLDILRATGVTLPTGTTGFAKGATFTLTNGSSGIRGMYENTGTNTSSVWQAIGLQTVTVTLSSVSFSTIATTPVELVADPGDGFVIVPVAVTGYRVFSSESWRFGSNKALDEGLEIKYKLSASGVNNTAFTRFASFSKGFLDGGSVMSAASPSYQVLYPIDGLASGSSALILTASSSATIDGDTYFKFDVQYRIVPLP